MELEELRKKRSFRLGKNCFHKDTTFLQPPFDIEIGCGVGFHPIQYALQNPDRRLLALERSRSRFEKFLRRIAGNGSPPNLTPIRGDALQWIGHNIPKKSVRRYFFLYPNPFPLKRRWHRMSFMEYLLETLEPSGTIHLATNVEDYYKEAKRDFSSLWGLHCIEDSILKRGALPRTHFEKKYLERGDSCWNLIFQV